jgi:SAM-dependent methyltransferase
MTSTSSERLKAHYQQLRVLDCEQLWTREVPAFDAAAPSERLRLVGVVRAVGVVFSETGSPTQRQAARAWLRGLLSDPVEKVRRYAMAALPKLGAGEAEENELLALAGKAAGEREQTALARTLGRIGGRATLEHGIPSPGSVSAVSLQRVKANVARKEGDGSLTLETPIRHIEGIRVILRCRSGLAPFVAAELEGADGLRNFFRPGHRESDSVELLPLKAFSLAQLYALRCFGTLVFPLGALPPAEGNGSPVEPRALAGLIASGHAKHLMRSFTKGQVRYRLNFAGRRANPALVEEVAAEVFAAAPALLNDPRQALWEVDVRENTRGTRVELVPRLRPDPRFAYRRGDVPAASHPPLAAAMARLAEVGLSGEEKVWDPFCGSGLELSECALRTDGGLFFGTDLEPAAVAVAKLNVASAVASSNRGFTPPKTRFVACDFRQAVGHPELSDLGGLSLIICNPPLGKRVPVEDLRSLVRSLFHLAGRLLRPGGRLVFVNPVDSTAGEGSLRCRFRQKVDLGFAHLHLEKWVKQEPRGSRSPAGKKT